MTVSVVRRVTPNLENLDKKPLYRGCVEAFADGVISGWCISATNPIAPVDLEIYLGKTLIGSVRTSHKRADLSETLGFPVKAGFKFELSSTDSVLGESLAEIREINPDGAALQSHLSVRVKDTTAFLPHGPEFHVSWQSVESFIEFAQSGAIALSDVSPSLTDLEEAPDHRGCVEAFADGVISGWCISATNPIAPVDLEIYLGKTLIGSVRTSGRRSDLSKVLGLPVKPSFRFAIEKCASSALPDVVAALSKVSGSDQGLESLVTVRIAGSSHRLPLMDQFEASPPDLEKLAGALQRRQRELFANRAIQERDALLTSPASASRKQDDVNVIAYYLPQFHPFPENNEWWGEGFTEWTNVTSAQPSFPSHYQPRLPADLGYYDLRLDEVQAKQVELAKKYGISAFCYYYYWFSGTQLMTMPIDRHVNQNLDLDFCLCWANENWSRRWDGSENDVLMGQQHTEDDDIAFIHSVIPYFQHPRYIKINGAPFLMIYRVSLLSNAERVVARWRSIVKEAGFPDLHVCMAETFGLENPHAFGVDSSCQFPPHGILAQDKTREIEELTPGFTGKIYDYNEVVANEIKRPDPGYVRFRTAMPSWDNTSRKGKAGHVFHNATPEVFEAWLSYLVAKVRREQPSELRYVFINAWNEWAEGAYLEPDRRNGHNNLKAVRNALTLRNAVIGESMLSAASPEETEFRRNVARVVSTYANANRQLLKLFSEAGLPARSLSPFIVRPDNAIHRVFPQNDAYLQLDAINGRVFGAPEATVLRQQNLALGGWLHVPAVTQSPQKPLFMWLVPLGGIGDGPDYVASVYDRLQRPDVAAALNLPEDEAWFGFHFTGDLTAVDPGSYRLSVLLASVDDSRDAIAVPSQLILHVG